MAISQRITISVTDGGNAFSSTITDAPDAETVINLAVAANQTNQHVDFTCDNSQIISLYMLSTGGDLTVTTNNSGSPVATISLKNGIPLFWHNTGGYSSVANSPFGSTDVTQLYLTNTTATQFQLIVGIANV